MVPGGAGFVAGLGGFVAGLERFRKGFTAGFGLWQVWNVWHLGFSAPADETCRVLTARRVVVAAGLGAGVCRVAGFLDEGVVGYGVAEMPETSEVSKMRCVEKF
jgi:hypothetical protein